MEKIPLLQKVARIGYIIVDKQKETAGTLTDPHHHRDAEIYC
jgi:hypothetical protein